MAVIILFLIKLSVITGLANDHYFAVQVASYAAYINISLAIFNMIPIPPLDGSKVLGVLLPDKMYHLLLNQGSKVGLILLLAIMLLNRMGYSPIGRASTAVFNYLFRLIV